MSWLHCFWGVGTIISPYIMSYALTTSSWQNGYRMVSFLQMGITMILFVTLPVWKVNKTAEQQEEQHEVIGIRGAVKIKGVPRSCLDFLLLCIGIYTDPLVKQLSGRCKRYLCGACGGICGIVLQRYHARKIFGRICDGKIR